MSKSYYVKSKQHSGGRFLCGQYELIVSATSIKEAKSKVKDFYISSNHKIVEVSEIKDQNLLNDTPYIEMHKIN